MLRFLRKYSSSIGVKILYGLLAALFILRMAGGIAGAGPAAHARSAAERALRPQPVGGQPARRARAGRVRGRGPTGPPEAAPASARDRRRRGERRRARGALPLRSREGEPRLRAQRGGRTR